MQRGFFSAGVLARHGRGANHALNFTRVDRVDGDKSLRGQGAVFVFLVAKLVDNYRQGAHSFLSNVFGLLARETSQKVAQSSEAGVDKNGMLSGRGSAQSLEKLRDAGLGDVVLLDRGFGVGHSIDLVIEGGIAAQEVEQVGDLLVCEAFSHGARARSGLSAMPAAVAFVDVWW